MLVHYAPDRTSSEDIFGAVGARAGAVQAAAGPAATPGSAHGPSLLATGITQALTEINMGVRRSTGGWLDLGTLLPLVLGAWAVRDLIRGQVGPLAWSSALWYAHGLFRDYSLPSSAAEHTEDA